MVISTEMMIDIRLLLRIQFVAERWENCVVNSLAFRISVGFIRGNCGLCLVYVVISGMRLMTGP